MAQENPTEEAQGEQQQEVLYYYSSNRYWQGAGKGTRRIHHKDQNCRIGKRIGKQNRIVGRRDDTEPCSVCCMSEIVDAQRNSG